MAATLVLVAAPALGGVRIRPADKRSGYFFTSRETQAMQDDDSANPGILWVQEGEDDERWGQQLRGQPISQGHSNAYPAYRLEWQAVGSLQRRLRNCNIGVRAEPYPYGAQEYVNLELFLAWRASGLRIETPGVRR